MKNKTLLHKVKENVTHKLQAGLVLLVAVIMIFNTSNFVVADNNDSTVLNMVVNAGVLEIVNLDATATFNSLDAGDNGTVNTLLENGIIRDYRESPAEYTVYAYSAALAGQTDSNYEIPNTAITVHPDTATIVNVDQYDTNSFGALADHNLSVNSGMFNSTYNAVGAVAFNELQLNLYIDGSYPAQEYSGTMVVSVIADS